MNIATKPLNLFDVYQCETRHEDRPNNRYTSHIAVRLDSQWQPIDPVPGHAVRCLGRFPARSKGDAIRDAIALRGIR